MSRIRTKATDPNDNSGKNLRRLKVKQWGEEPIEALERLAASKGLTLKEAVQWLIEQELIRLEGKN